MPIGKLIITSIASVAASALMVDHGILQGGRPRQADHAVLGGDVGADPGVAGQRADRRVVDDRAAALALHLPQLVLHAAPHATQVDPDNAVPFLAGAVGGRGDAGHTPKWGRWLSAPFPSSAGSTPRSTTRGSHWTANAL